VRISLGLSPKDFLIAIVGSPFSYGDNLMEEALVLQAVSPLLQRYLSENSTQSELKVKVFTGNITEKHRMALEVIIHVFMPCLIMWTVIYSLIALNCI
jgi:hypothetical protein